MHMPKWASRTSILRGLTMLIVVVAGLFGAIAPANAAPTFTTELGQVQTLANGALVCGGSLRVWASTNPDWGDQAILNVQSGPMTGYAGGSSLTPVCSVGVKVAWRNVSTGRTGEWNFILVAGVYGSIQYALFQPTGRGHVVTDTTTSSLHLPGHGEFNV